MQCEDNDRYRKIRNQPRSQPASNFPMPKGAEVIAYIFSVFQYRSALSRARDRGRVQERAWSLASAHLKRRCPLWNNKRASARVARIRTSAPRALKTYWPTADPYVRYVPKVRSLATASPVQSQFPYHGGSAGQVPVSTMEVLPVRARLLPWRLSQSGPSLYHGGSLWRFIN